MPGGFVVENPIERRVSFLDIAELAEIDSQLLTDDLPIDAYLDRGFQNWLKRRNAGE